MTLALTYTSDLLFDLVIDEAMRGLETDDGLFSDVARSLFTDRRATDAELQAAGLRREENRGWPGDSYAEVEGDAWGSLLWLCERMGRNDDTLRRIESYALESLQWMLDDQVASAITATAFWLAPRAPFAGLDIEITRGNAERWRAVWNATTGELLSQQG